MSQVVLQREQLLRKRSDSTRDSRSIALFRNRRPRRHAPAFLDLFYALEARRTGVMSLVVQFISAGPKAGVSTVSSGYARVAAEAAERPVLFVDATASESDSPGDSGTLVEAFTTTGLVESAVIPARNAENLYWARLCDTPDGLLHTGMDRLRLLLDLLRTQHSLVVLDSSSVLCPGSAAMSRICDGTVLVVEAGSTGQSEIDIARRKIEQLGGELVGLVLNRERSRPAIAARQFS